MDRGYTVKEIIEMDLLKKVSRVLAGQEGLNKIVNWVHILEIRDVVDLCVDGNELVLTTGIGFSNKKVANRFFKELIRKKVSGLCIETPLYVKEIDSALIDLANEAKVPLIEIHEISRFLDISKKINTLILQRSEEIFSDSSKYDEVIESLSNKGAIEDVIKYTSEFLDIDIAYLPSKGKKMNTGAISMSSIQESIIDSSFRDDDLIYRGKFAIKRLEIHGLVWGHIVFVGKTRDLTDFDILILNRLSSKVKLDVIDLSNKRFIAYNLHADWIKEWITGKITATLLQEKMPELAMKREYNNFCVLKIVLCSIIEVGDEESFKVPWEHEDFRDVPYILQKYFEEMNARMVGYLNENILMLVVMSSEKEKDVFLEKIRGTVLGIKGVDTSHIDFNASRYYIGKIVGDHSSIRESYESLEDCKDLACICDDGICIYDQLHIKRLFSEVVHPDIIQKYISDYLKELVLPENIQLLETLKVFLDNNCSKQKTAEKLFVSRQTLYTRIEKIAEILGDDFYHGERRLAIEVAVMAKEYLGEIKQL